MGLDDRRLIILPVDPPKPAGTIFLSTGSSASSLIDLKVPSYGGSFTYRNIDQGSRNLDRRFLIWRVTDDVLDIEEHSLDTDLCDNSLRFQFKNDVILHGVTVSNSDGRLYILVPTFSVAQRICVPCHGGGSLLQESDISGNLSVLALVNVNELPDHRHCHTLNIGTSSATPRTAACALSSSEEALFAYAFTDGSIVLITMAAYDEDGPTTQDTFTQTSVVRRILTGFMSPFSRGETALTTPTSLIFQVLPEDVLLCASTLDQKLRVWSCRKKELVNESGIINPNNASKPASYLDGDKWQVKSSIDKESPFLVVYTISDGVSQFHVFCSTLQGRQWDLVKVMEFEAPEADLLDFSLSDKTLFTLWTQNGTTVFRWKDLNLASLDQLKYASWNSDSLRLEYTELEDKDFENADVVMDAVFNSRVFSFEVVSKSIKMCSRDLPIRTAGQDWNRLRRDVEDYIDKLEKEETLAMAASATNVSSAAKIKFLRSIWTSCLQYDQECRKPLALLHCPNVGLYGVVLLKKVAFLTDVTFSITEILSRAGLLPSMQANVNECLMKIKQMYTTLPQLEKAFDTKILNQDQASWTLICDQLVEMLYTQDPSDIIRDISGVEPVLETALKAILRYLDRSGSVLQGNAESMETDENDRARFGFDAAFRGDLGSMYLSAAVDNALQERYELTKLTLLLLALCVNQKWKLKLPAARWAYVEGKCIPQLSRLIRLYAILRWIFSHPAYGSFKMVRSMGSKQHFILDHLINHPTSEHIRNYWRIVWRRFDWKNEISSEMMLIVQASIDAFWPNNMFAVIFDYLCQTEQFHTLLELCDCLDSHFEQLQFCRIFMQAYGLLQVGRPKEALVKFRLAFEGIDRDDPLLMEQLTLMSNDQRDTPPKVLYFLKVMELYEKKGQSDYVIETCEDAIRFTEADDSSVMPILTIMFKHYMRLQKYDDALKTVLKMNWDENTQRIHLRQFIIQLQEEKLLGKLIDYEFGDLEKEVLAILESKARAADILTENYYHFLYGFFVSKSNYRKAASFSYEMAMRYRKEGTGLESLKNQVTGLAACLHTLALENDGNWIEISGGTVDTDQMFAEAGSSPKRAADGEEKLNAPTGLSKRIGMREIESEYIAAKGNLAVAEIKGVHTSLLSEKELVKSLTQYNLFDLAVQVATVHDLSMVDLIDCLALRCVQSDRPRLSSDLEKEDWIRLSENRNICSTISTNRSQNFAWMLLQSYLKHLANVVPISPLYAAAMRRFLSLSQTIPPWFVNEFKKVDLPELLRLLIEYDRLDETQRLVCDYIDAVLGISADDFGLRETLTVGKRAPVWLPYSAIDLLMALLAQRMDDTKAVKLHNELEEKLKHYFNQLNVHMQLVRKK